MVFLGDSVMENIVFALLCEIVRTAPTVELANSANPEVFSKRKRIVRLENGHSMNVLETVLVLTHERRVKLSFVKALKTYTFLGPGSDSPSGGHLRTNCLLELLERLAPPTNGAGVAIVNLGLHLHQVRVWHFGTAFGLKSTQLRRRNSGATLRAECNLGPSLYLRCPSL